MTDTTYQRPEEPALGVGTIFTETFGLFFRRIHIFALLNPDWTYRNMQGTHYLTTLNQPVPHQLLENLGWVFHSKDDREEIWRNGSAVITVPYDPNLLPMLHQGPHFGKKLFHPDEGRDLLQHIHTQVDKYELLVRSGWGLES